MNRDVLQKLLEAIAQTRVLVVGDAMLDRYWQGGVERISPEAPVPVVAVNRVDERAGGAANVARNVRALGARCALLSITGDDREADSLQALLERDDIDGELHRDKLINTTVKLRVLSRNQQLIRIDFESPASKDARVRLLDSYLKRFGDFDAVIISDYGKGGLGYVQEMIVAARGRGVPVVVDPKGADYGSYRGATLITPNRKEFELVAGKARDDAELARKGVAMATELDLAGVLVTRGEEGMTLIEHNGRTLTIAAHVREVYDVTGAGDSVVAAIGCAYATGGRLDDGLRLANIAAGIVVGKLGAATASPAEILHAQATYDVE